MSEIVAFRDACRERIPTADEFVNFVEKVGWRVVCRDDGTASLRVPDRSDPVALAMARMLAREPYRTNVLAEAMRRWKQAEAPNPAAGPTPAESPAQKSAHPDWAAREWLWRTGLVESEAEGDPTWGDQGRHKQTAFWWRLKGSVAWRAVPGVNPEALPVPGGERLEGGDEASR